MKKFIKKILFFITMMLFVVIIIHYLLERIIYDTNFEIVLHEKINADIVIMGNSRAGSNYSTSIFDSLYQCKTFNLGLSGYPIDFQYNLRLIPYLNRNSNPKLIIQEINTIAFLCDFNKPKCANLIRYNKLPEYEYYNKYINSPWYNKYIPLLKYKGLINNDVLYQNIFKFKKNTNNKTTFNSEIFDIENYLIDIESNKIAVFKDYVEKINNENMKIIFVFSPIYYRFIDQATNNEVFWQEISTIANLYNIPVLDYSRDSLCFDSTNFMDYIHMNKYGQEKFTLKLINDLDSMELSDYLYDVLDTPADFN